MMHMVKFLDLRIFAGDQAAIGISGFVNDDIAEHAEDGFEPGEAFHGGSGARELLPVEGDGPVLVFYRNDRLIEPAFLDGFGCTFLAFHGEFIDRLTINAFQCSNGVGANPLL